MIPKPTVTELMESIWFALYDANIMNAMKMLKDQTVMYSKEQRKYLEEIANGALEEDGGEE
jgi:hypothetical protein